MTSSPRPTINLLCLDSPGLGAAIGGLGEAERSLASALAQLGWQVNLFTSAEVAPPPWLAPQVQILPLEATLAPAAIAQAIETHQLQQGLVWPLLHTFGCRATRVGAFVKAEQGWRWLHTPTVPDDGASLTADQRLLLTPPAVTVLPFLPMEAHPLSLPRPWLSRSAGLIDWVAIARCLAPLYRYHLAIHVGAMDLALPAEVALPFHSQVNQPLSTPHWVALGAAPAAPDVAFVPQSITVL